ncbi:MAG: class I SAM-dependent methyltransferase [Saccharolobus sp.]
MKIYTKEAYEKIVYRRKSIHFVNLIRGKIVVDVGCGSGQNCLALKNRFTICLDFAINQLIEAKRRGCEHLIQADMEYLPFRQSSIHSLMYIASLHHLKDPSLAIKEAKRVLVNNGEILVTVWLVQPNFLLKHYIIKKSVINGVEIKRFYKLYYPWELLKLMKKSGFRKEIYKLYRMKSILPNNAMYYGFKQES